MDRLLPAVDLDVDDDVQEVGLNRVHRSLQCALKRNKRAAKKMKQLHTLLPAHSISSTHLFQEARRRAEVLNGDLLLLYASSVAVHSSLATGRKLAGDGPRWRERGFRSSQLIAILKVLEGNLHHPLHVVSNLAFEAKVTDGVKGRLASFVGA